MDAQALQPLYVVLAALLRSVLGWLKMSLRDGVISEFELRQLGETVARVGLIGIVVAYFPGIDVSWFEASVVAIAGDIFLCAVKKSRIVLKGK